MASLNFDATAVAPQDSYEPIPAGEYLAMITDSEMRDTKAGNGSYLKLTFEIADGASKGRLIFENLNLDNPNKTAVEIANRALSSICASLGKKSVQDSSELHYQPLTIKVGIRDGSNGYDASNNIKAYKPAGSVKAAPAPAQEIPAAVIESENPAPSKAPPPWNAA